MREARPDDPIFKAGFVIGEKRLKNLPEDTSVPSEIEEAPLNSTPSDDAED
jgi:hypothetical protein